MSDEQPAVPASTSAAPTVSATRRARDGRAERVEPTFRHPQEGSLLRASAHRRQRHTTPAERGSDVRRETSAATPAGPVGVGHYGRVVARDLSTGPGGRAAVSGARSSAPAGYLDAASAAPLHPAAREALLAALDQGWADPARRYHLARRARILLDAARESVAAALGARPDEVSFTTSGTQAVGARARRASSRGRERVGDRVLSSAVEHSAVLHAATAAVGERRGDASRSTGSAGSTSTPSRPAPARPASRCSRCSRPTTRSAPASPSTSWRRSPGSTASPCSSTPRSRSAATPLPDGWSVLAASGHKWGGPAGVGVLAVRTGVRWRSPSPEGALEHGRVPGFVDVPAVVAAAAALEAVERRAGRRVGPARARSSTGSAPRCRELVPGHRRARRPGRPAAAPGDLLASSTSRARRCSPTSTAPGSRCRRARRASRDSLQPSHVLAAMGALTHGNLRVSLPAGDDEADVDRFLEVLPGSWPGSAACSGAEGL